MRLGQAQTRRESLLPTALWFMEMKRFEVFASLSSQGNCAGQAAAYLSREKSEQFSGIGVVPHDSRFQLYDKVRFVDNRGV